ncbi:MAG: hypothetical protein KBC41_02945 [Candidatus Pacebacteria bacterium]|nr:hypothetical protein [Candidatus Paceibacterota bacterium]MBP9867008.1 hypothetical protein [Candidatus Paceibacterota bacterium]
MVGHGDLSYSLLLEGKNTFMEPIISETSTGLVVSIDGVSYLMEWIDSMLKVTGPDVCYYIVETARGIEQANCALNTFILLIPNY